MKSKSQEKSNPNDVKNAVQQARPNDKPETILKPASKKEVKEAVKEINPDENSMDSRG